MNVNLQEEWHQLTSKLSKQFGMEADLDAIIFLIGIQELGKVPEKLNKDQKVDVMHVAICSLLSNFGYYEFVGEDKDGWPHWNRNKKLPPLNDKEQDVLIKNAILDYFKDYSS